jgi:hypothetical protein
MPEKAGVVRRRVCEGGRLRLQLKLNETSVKRKKRSGACDEADVQANRVRNVVRA